jgi:hypothetical protein
VRTVKIEDFHALLTSEGKGNALLTALRELMDKDAVEFVNALAKANLFGWSRVDAG